jgi:1,3-1,4-beta-glucanase
VVVLRQNAERIYVDQGREYTFPAAGETKTNYFTVESTGEWSVTSTAAWCTVEPKGGEAGTKQVTIKAEAHSKKEAREAKLTFALKANAYIRQVVTVMQKANAISVAPSEDCVFSAAGETKSSYLTVESTGEWSVTSSAAWCTVGPKGGEAGTKQVTVKVEANSQKEAREAELTFALKANANIKQVVTVKQAGRGSNQNPSAVENVLFSGIAVAPNPFGAQLVIKNSEGIKGRYELVSTGGVLVRSGSLQGCVSVLRTDGLKPGVYLLRILAGEGAKTFSVVKE